jgi:diguanylate cyclase (GGDEF)-like protein
MKYTGRIAIVTIALVFIVLARVYGMIYLNYSPINFPFFGMFILLIFWWLGKQYDTVKFLSVKDVLTKLYNRRYVIHAFPKLSVLVDRKVEKLSLFLIDLDNFKMINDTYGHERGDKVLQHLSNVLLIITSKSDIVARWAGDEFLIISPFTDEKDKEIINKRIHKELKKSFEELKIDITVSIGTSEYPKDAKTLDVLLNIADQNMYKIKSQKKHDIKTDSPLESTAKQIKSL